MNSENPRLYPSFHRPGCFFVMVWAIATVLGFALSLSIVTIGERPDLGLWQGVLGGGIVGLTQGLILMRYRLGSGWWIVANTVAWGIAGASSIGAIGWFAPRGLTALPSRLIYGTFDGLKIGIIAGFSQWLALKQTASKFSASWIAWNTLAWILGLAFGWSIGGILRQITNLFISEVVGLIVTWTIVGLIGGIALGFSLRNACRQPPDSPLTENEMNQLF